MNLLCFNNVSNERSVPKKKPKKHVPAPDSGEESVPRKKPKKAGAARVSLGVGDSDLHLPRKKKQKKQDPKQSCN